MKWIKITFLICAIMHLKVEASSTGAPLDACESMLPNHAPFTPQPPSPPPPVEVDVPKWAIFPNEKIEITIRATGGAVFRGFFVQARVLSEVIPVVIGRFNSSDEVNAINCFGMIQSAATHTNGSPKTQVVLEWEAPDLTDNALVFELFVTIVKSGDVFWDPIRIGLLAVVPEQTTTYQPGDVETIYEGCGEIKVCYGIPEGCIASMSCDLFGAVNHDSGLFEFELLSMPNHNYIAFGLSQTPSMQDTSVIECVRPESAPNTIEAFTSWNPVWRDNNRNEIPQAIIRQIESRFIDARIYCRVERDAFSTINGFNFDLINDMHFLLLAGGVQISPNSVGPHGPFNRGVSSESYWLADPPMITPPPDDDFDWIYEECGDTKVCFGIPNNCVSARNCDLFGGVTYSNGDFDFELLSSPNHRYIALGLSQTQSMQDASVIECIYPEPTPGVISAFTSWNFPGRNNARTNIPQTIISLLESRLIDGRIYCRIRRDPSSVVNGVTIDLVNDPHYLMLAGGIILTADSVGPHGVNRGVTSERLWLRPQTPDHPIYEGCGSNKVCFGIPNECVASRDCNMLGTVFDNNGEFEFELLGMSGHNYIAFGLSQTPSMGDASVIECVQQFPNAVLAFSSWNIQFANNRIDVPQGIIRTLETSVDDGRIYCKLQRDTISTVRGQTFDLANEQHHLLLAGGIFFNPDSVGFHSSTDRAVSSDRYWLTDPPPPDFPIYDGCGNTKLCFGIPNGCDQTRDCDMLGTVFNNNGDFEFELLGMATHNYIALGLSQTLSMGESSVIECVNQAGAIFGYTSWNLARVNIRDDVPQDIIRTLEIGFIDGRIYCKLQRNTVSIVRGQTFDLANEQHHLLLAGGLSLFVNSVGPHTLRDISGERLWLTDPPEITTTTTTTEVPTTTTTTTTEIPSDFPIYDGCGTTKLCFGIPNRCPSSRNCNMLATVFDNNGDFEFELLGMASHNYVAFGLSQTPVMGQSSVIECVQQPLGIITGFTSWNVEGYDNNRENVPQEIMRPLETRFIDGRIYCKLQRDTISQVRGQTFDLRDERHYLLLAGSAFLNPNSVGIHTPADRAISGERYWLTDPREVQKASLSALLLTHGSLMIVAWIGLTSIGIVMARYFKTSWQNRKLFGKDVWFVWHVFCMFLTWAFTLIGFILIFVDVGQWNTSVHAVMGCVVLGLVIVQAIGGAVRPDPKAKGRLLFNWMHKAFGNITHLLAVLTIFYAVPLSQARLPDYTTYLLVGFVSYYLLMHIILTTVDLCSQMKRKKRLGVEINNNNARFEMIKRTLFGLHVVIVTLFVIALVLIFTINPF